MSSAAASAGSISPKSYAKRAPCPAVTPIRRQAFGWPALVAAREILARAAAVTLRSGCGTSAIGRIVPRPERTAETRDPRCGHILPAHRYLAAMTRILLLIPSRTYRTADFVEAARTLDVEVVIGTEERPALADVMGERWLALSLTDVASGRQAIVDYAHEHALDAVIPIDDGSTLVAAAGAAALGLPHNTLAAGARRGHASCSRRPDSTRPASGRGRPMPIPRRSRRRRSRSSSSRSTCRA